MKLFFTILFTLSNFNLAYGITKDAQQTCLESKNNNGPYDQWGYPQDTLVSGNNKIHNAQAELDHIYSLLAYAVVFKNWQQESDSNLHNGLQYSKKFANTLEPRNKKLDKLHHKHSRGHNFGAILVNTNNEVVHWGRNNNHALCDETQHGETRLIQQFLKKSRLANLKGYTIHVTGDSCPMCAGMISQQKISRAILGLSNPIFGKNFDRMNLNSKACGNNKINGLSPVARQVQPLMSSTEIRKLLDKSFRNSVINSCKSANIDTCKSFPSQTKFLKSARAHDIFELATEQFINYKVIYPNQIAAGSKKTNTQLYNTAVTFLRTKVSLQVELPPYHKPGVPTQQSCNK